MRQIYYNYFIEPKNDQLLQYLTIAAQKLRSPVLIEDRSQLSHFIMSLQSKVILSSILGGD